MGRIAGFLCLLGLLGCEVEEFQGFPPPIAKARTAAYLSSNQHAFTTLTACYITRPHFPPGVRNTPGGPIYGAPFSSLYLGDVQPLYKNGCLVGGAGVTGAPAGFQLAACSGVTEDEVISLGASLGYSPPRINPEEILPSGTETMFGIIEANIHSKPVA